MSRLAIALSLALASSGCGTGEDNESLRREIAALKEEVETLRNASIQGDVDSTTNDMMLGVERFYQTHAVLDCSGNGFVPVEESGRTIKAGGYFLIACEDAVPYLNGHRLTFRIGNPQAMSYRGLRLTLHWGKKLSDDGLWEVGWRKKEIPDMAKQTFELTDAFVAGSWTSAQVVLAPSKPEDLSVIVVNVDTSSSTVGLGR